MLATSRYGAARQLDDRSATEQETLGAFSTNGRTGLLDTALRAGSTTARRHSV